MADSPREARLGRRSADRVVARSSSTRIRSAESTDSAPTSICYGSGVASALVPAPRSRRPGSCTSRARRRSRRRARRGSRSTAPKRRPAAAGNVDRHAHVGPAARQQRRTSRCARRAVLEVQRHARRARERRRVRDQDVGLGALRPADFAFGQRPPRAGRRRARRVVRLGPEVRRERRARPPHRPLDDDRHAVGRRRPCSTPRRCRAACTPDPAGICSSSTQIVKRPLAGHVIALRVRRAVEQQVVDASPRPACRSGFASRMNSRRTARSRLRPGTSCVAGAVTPARSVAGRERLRRACSGTSRARR